MNVNINDRLLEHEILKLRERILLRQELNSRHLTSRDTLS